jgi:hypothetical protein
MLGALHTCWEVKGVLFHFEDKESENYSWLTLGNAEPHTEE